MRKGFLGSLTALLTGAGLALAEPPVSSPGPMPAQPAAGSCAPMIVETLPSQNWVPPACASDHAAVCGPPGRVWASAEYLLWWIKDSDLPPLVTSGSALDPVPGALGQPGTTILFGGEEVDNGQRHGGRFTVGTWLNEEQTLGVEASYLFLGSRSRDFEASGDGSLGSPVLARPFVDVLAGGVPNSEVFAFPGLIAGGIKVSSSSRLQAGELNALCNVCCGCSYRLDLLGGFRYLRLDERLSIDESGTITPLLPPVPPFFGGNTVAVSDRFDTRNQFYGGQIGARAEVRFGRLFVNGTGKVALGCVDQVVNVSGSTTFTPPGGPAVTFPAGLLALQSNSGRFDNNRFAVVPEANINVGVQVTDNLRGFVGYSFLYLSQAARPGDQIDLNLNTTQIPTAPDFGGPAGTSPALLIRDGDFWAQGLNFGLELRF